MVWHQLEKGHQVLWWTQSRRQEHRIHGSRHIFQKGKVYNYVVSVPWRKVKAHEVLLAWEMNRKPLPKIHGYHLRTVVYGYIGARYAYDKTPVQEALQALTDAQECKVALPYQSYRRAK